MSDGLRGGTVLDGRWRLVREAGAAAAGTIWVAEELRGDEVVGRAAIQVVGGDEAAVRRLLDEAAQWAQAGGECILVHRDQGMCTTEAGPAGYLVYDLPEQTLRQHLRAEGPLAPEAMQPVARALAGALVVLHGRQRRHGQIRPDNLFRSSAGWQLGCLAPAGSLAYDAPEVLRGQPLLASDIYAFGVTLLEMLTGHTAHDATEPAALRSQIEAEPPNIPDSLPEPWRSLLWRCLAKEARYRPSASEVQAVLNGEPLPALQRQTRVPPAPPPVRMTDAGSSVPVILIGCAAAALVGVALLAILAAVLFPVFAKAREKARQASCQANLKMISAAALQYAADYDDRLPRVSAAAPWPSLLEPYTKSTVTFECPSQVPGTPSYCFTMGYGPKTISFSKPAYTVMFADGPDLQHLAPCHNDGLNLAFLDGHVQWKAQAALTGGGGLVWPGLGGKPPQFELP